MGLAAGDSKRLTTMDGLRGWAALSVIVYHTVWETFGIVYPQFRNIAVASLGDGRLAVAIFFCLSGYVLTLRRWHRTDNPDLLLVLVRRYVRLTIPILAIVLVAWALMSLNLTAAHSAAVIVHRKDWLGVFADFQPDLLGAIRFGLVGVYWTPPYESYGPFLWTMAIELFGSLCVLAISHNTRLFREAYSILALLLVLTLVPTTLDFLQLAACFPAGALIALAQRDGLIFRSEPGPLTSLAASIMLCTWVVAAGAFQMIFVSPIPSACAGTVIFIAATRSRSAQRFLSLPVSHFLGRISFPLYLVQYPVIITLMSWLIVQLDAAGLLNPWTAIGVAIIAGAACILSAWAFMPVERFTLALVKRIEWPRFTRRSRTAP